MSTFKIKHIIRYFIIGLFSISLFSQTLEKAFLEADTNKENLEAVLEHYKQSGENQKYEAAIFLIENMTIHESQKYNWVDKNGNNVIFSEFDYEDFGLALEAFKKFKDSLNIKPLNLKNKDISIISSEFLINNIDLAFTEWENNAWSKNYSFKVFCEYILPYRSLIEPLENWREEYRFLTIRATSNLEDNTDPVEVCTNIIKELKGFSFVYGQNPLPAPLLSPQQLLFRRQGSCPELANLVLLASRALGVAVTFDFTPHYAASSNRHYWNTVVDKNGNHIPFNGNSVGDQNGYPYTYTTNHKRLAKVFRTTFSIQQNALATKLIKDSIPESFLFSKNIIDVTSEYVSVGDINYYPENDNHLFTYLNVFNTARWNVIDWTEKKEDYFKFTNIGKDIVYLPSFYQNGKTILGKFPFLLDNDGTSQILKPNFDITFGCTLSRINEFKKGY